jgi:hypothetical protein
MAHVHQEDRGSYYLEQLCTIAFCAAFGAVCVMLWWIRNYSPPEPPKQPMLDIILVEKFHLPVLLGGITLLLLAIVRAAAVWTSVAEPNENHNHGDEHVHDHEHSHDHDHTHEHAHEHHHHDHEHDHNHDHDHAHSHALDHGHDHGLNPWRYVVLLVPLVFYFLGLPIKAKEDVEAFTESSKVAAKGGLVVLDFKELETAASQPENRQFLEGKKGRMKGQLAFTGNPKRITLVKINMSCCYADAIVNRSNVAILLPDAVRGIRENDWIEVEGQIEFRKAINKDNYIPVLVVASMDKVQKTSPG